MKITVAMSGGVDSSVTAALLKKAGHDVAGLTMRLPYDNGAVEAAARSAAELGIPHDVIDVSTAFTSGVIEPFCREYMSGQTPNPCVECNNKIKFGVILDYVLSKGAEHLATGHYARLETEPDSCRPVLKKGRDRRKDQSYFLCRLTAAQLGTVMFPLGDMTKQQVHDIAKSLNMAVTERDESQEICFIPDGDTAAFLARHTGEQPIKGPILDAGGNVIGEHHGITAYTIGQRKGLGVAASQPLYVIAIDAGNNAVIVGEKDATLGTTLTASAMNWLTPEVPKKPFTAAVKIRYRAVDAAATILPMPDNRILANFKQPQFAITPGQIVALYDGDFVVGGGVIESTPR